MHKKVRIGIDVGGTFTDAVVIDNETLEIIGRGKILTTHAHEHGVAHGIVQIIRKVIEENELLPEDVVFIAHGTTQATNALLEGDVAKVGVIGMATGLDAVTARPETNIGDIRLAQGKYLYVCNTFIDTKKLDEAVIYGGIENVVRQGAQVIVASEAYSVDNPENEKKVMNSANKLGLYATGGHEISELYGLKVRTQTAIVNASLIPKMMETADMTVKSVESAGIKSELMIMRCDGGVMNVEEVRKRPILTMLSGLAAGVAGALMYEKVTDGIFLEVGGTSTDISVIKNGKVMIKNAQVGGHKTYLKSLDVRTLGVAGGSMIYVEDRVIRDVGPRSAHIAQIEYECFTDVEEFENPRLAFISPKEGDPSNYAVVSCGDGKKYALTLAGASNLLGYIPDGDYAFGNRRSAERAWNELGRHIGKTAKEAARIALDIAAEKVMGIVNDLIDNYELDQSFITLVGGGGSASVLVPPLSEAAGFRHSIAKNAPYISTIGVALAMVREQIERTVLNPTKEDIMKIRFDVMEKILKSGANEQTVDITIEIDAQKNILRAVATGATELRTKDLTNNTATPEQMKKTVALAFNMDESNVEYKLNVGRWHVLQSQRSEKRFMGLLKSVKRGIAVADREGVVRQKGDNGHYILLAKKEIISGLPEFIDEYTVYSDANYTLPKVFVFYNEKMCDFSGIQSREQLYATIDVELQFLGEGDKILTVVYKQ